MIKSSFLEERVQQALELEVGEFRHFIVGFSGGSDSTSLLFMLTRLRKLFPIRLSALHINYALRGKDSEEDETFATEFCKRWDVNLLIHRAKAIGSTSVQEKARQIRLDLSHKILLNAEWVEAHHADDQIETFLFRLFRGTGLLGLRGMKKKDQREGRILWRPFLKVFKKDILNYAEENHLTYRIDRSNLRTAYDRNWIRNELIPLLLSRFPHFEDSIVRLCSQIQLEEDWKKEDLHAQELRILLREAPPVLDRKNYRQCHSAWRHRFLHRLFHEAWQISLSRSKVLELDELICKEVPFTWNAPHGMIVRSLEEKVEFDRGQKSLGKRLKGKERAKLFY